MSSKTYIKASLAVKALESELGMTGIKYYTVEQQSKRADKHIYHQIHFTRADNTSILSHVYCRLNGPNREPYVLVDSFRERMPYKDTFIDKEDDVNIHDILFSDK
jgi:hypothetical protein